jgi:hypothetical protein
MVPLITTPTGAAMFVLKIDTDNAAFSENRVGEIARILRVCAEHVHRQANDRHASGDLFDINGNRVAHWEFLP